MSSRLVVHGKFIEAIVSRSKNCTHCLLKRNLAAFPRIRSKTLKRSHVSASTFCTAHLDFKVSIQHQYHGCHHHTALPQHRPHGFHAHLYHQHLPYANYTPSLPTTVTYEASPSSSNTYIASVSITRHQQPRPPSCLLMATPKGKQRIVSVIGKFSVLNSCQYGQFEFHHSGNFL